MRATRLIVWTVGTAALIACAVWMTAPATAPALAQAPRPAPKWEYLTLDIPPNGTQPTIQSADLRLWGQTWSALAEKLKMAVPDKRSDKDIRWLVLNHLGSQGWELATHTCPPNAGELYTFKRSAP